MSWAAQEPLFTQPAPPPRRRRPATPDTVRYARYRPTGRRALCDDCCDDIDARGWLAAPPPNRATWTRLATGEPTRRICQEHHRRRREAGS